MITHITDMERVLTDKLRVMTEALDSVTKERDEFKKDLIFVERWANHHGTKSCHSAESILGVIQHYPSIKAITKSYVDGVIPTTPDPFAERDTYAKAADDMAMSHKAERDGLAADVNVLLGHMDTINRCSNDPAICNLSKVVIERFAMKGKS